MTRQAGGRRRDSGRARAPRRALRVPDRAHRAPLAPLCALVALVAVVALAAACGPRARPGTQARHVLLLTVAGLRADHTSMLAYARGTTRVEPSEEETRTERRFGLDDLAAEGVLFANAFAPSADPWASLVALATGRSPLATGVTSAADPLAADERTLAEVFARAGFRTTAFVACADGRAPEAWDRGFEESSLEHDDDAVLARAIRWAGRADFGHRHLLWLHLEGPRPPFAPEPLGAGVDFASRYDGDGLADGPVALYDAEIARATHLLHRFLAYWSHAGREARAFEDTLVVFAGASGLADPGAPGEDQLSDGALHVPLFLRHPSSLTGRRVFADVVELEDVLPTLVDWLGLERPRAATGRSLAPRTDGYLGRHLDPEPAFAVALPGPRLSARDAHWRAVFPPGRLDASEVVPVSGPVASPTTAEADRSGHALGRAVRAWIRSQALAPRFAELAALASP